MKTVFYKKVGRRYVPVHEYDSELVDSLPKGNHLIMSYPGGQSTRYNVDPDYAAMIAAGRAAEEAISESLRKALDLRLPGACRDKPLTEEQLEAWTNLIKVFGEQARQLEWPSIREATEAGVKAMQLEADKLLSHPAVREAYDHFIFIAKLVNENSKET